MKPPAEASASWSRLWRTHEARLHSSAVRKCCSFKTVRSLERLVAAALKLRFGQRQKRRCAPANLSYTTSRSPLTKRVKREWFAEGRWIFLWRWWAVGLRTLVLSLVGFRSKDERPKTQNPMSENFLANYKAKHQHPLNRLLHTIGI